MTRTILVAVLCAVTIAALLDSTKGRLVAMDDDLNLRVMTIDANRVFAFWNPVQATSFRIDDRELVPTPSMFLMSSFLLGNVGSYSISAFDGTTLVGQSGPVQAVPFSQTLLLEHFAELCLKHMRFSAGGPYAVFNTNNDWHSSVHAHWALLRAARVLKRQDWVEYLDSRLNPAGLAAENEYLKNTLALGSILPFQLPYGRAWFLQFAIEWEQHTGGLQLREIAETSASSLLSYYQSQQFVSVEEPEYGNPCWALLNLYRWYTHRHDAVGLAKVVDLIDRWIYDSPSPVTFAKDQTVVYHLSLFGAWVRLIAETTSAESLAGFLQRHPIADADIQPFPIFDGRQAGNLWSRAWALKSLHQKTGEQRFQAAYDAHVAVLLEYHWTTANFGAMSHWLPQFAIYGLTDPIPPVVPVPPPPPVVPLALLTISPTEVTLGLRQSVLFTTSRPAGCTISPLLGSISGCRYFSPTGRGKVKQPMIVTVTATAPDGAKATATITLVP